MTIGINGYEAVVPRFGFDKKTGLPNRVGSSEVCFQWISWFSKIDKKNSYVVYLPTNPTADMPKESGNFKYKIIPSQRFWTIAGLSRVLRGEKDLDIFLSPTHYGAFFTPCPQVITILDVSYKKFPDLFTKNDLYKLALWGKYSVKKAEKIITISESSKNDIINEYKISPQKVEVAYLGVKDSLVLSMSKEDLFKKYSISSPYVLYVGTLQPRKNVKRLIEAFSFVARSLSRIESDAQLEQDKKQTQPHSSLDESKHIKSKNNLEDDSEFASNSLSSGQTSRSLELIIIGKKGWDYEEIIKTPERLGISDKVKFLHNVDDRELSAFYKNAQVFVLPSLYEGFGLPVLEAMKYGCPVITSNVSSLPEAGGDAALYVDPKDTDDIAEKIKNVLQDDKLRKRMVSEGSIQYKKFTWEKSAKKVLEVLEGVVGE